MQIIHTSKSSETSTIVPDVSHHVCVCLSCWDVQPEDKMQCDESL